MDGFCLVCGVGSLAVAGFCYAAYKNIQNVASCLKNTETLNVGKELSDKIKVAPNQTLDYVAIRGDAKALDSTLKSSNVPSAKLLIHRTSIYEHRVEWVKSSRLWQDTRRRISDVINHVPFSLNGSTKVFNKQVKVTVDEPLSASGLEYNRIYDKYEPLNALSVSQNIVQWVSGEKTKGIQTVEQGLFEGTTLTAVGKVTLQDRTLKIVQPEGKEYILSKLPLDGIIREKIGSSNKLKYFAIGFAILGSGLLLYWLYRKWRRRPVVDDRFNPPPPGDGLAPDAGNDQLCVICLMQPRNVVILNCGHICACRGCASRVDICPMCRAEIVRLVPTYQS